MATPPTQDPDFAPNIMGTYRDGVSLLERGLTNLHRQWDALTGRIDALLRRVEHELNSDSIWATIAEWWTDAIADAAKKVRQLVNDVHRLVEQLFAITQKAAEGSIPIGSLFEVGLNYATKVNPPLSDIGNDMVGSGAIDNWRGPTRLTYQTRVQDQVNAVTSTVGKVKATSNWLADVAKANTEYMVQLSGQAAQVIGALAAVFVDATESAAGAVTQIVIALQHLSDTVGTAVTQAIQYEAGLAGRLADVLKQIINLANERGDHSGVGGGRWPQAVTG